MRRTEANFQESDGSVVDIFPVLGEPAAAIEPRNGTFYDRRLGNCTNLSRDRIA